MSVWRALLSRFVSGFAPSYTDLYDLAYDTQHPAGDTAHQGYNITDVGQLAFYTGGGITQDSWTGATYSSSWVDYTAGGTLGVASRVERGTGKVGLRGASNAGTHTDNTTVFTLPSGQRPSHVRYLSGVGYNGSAFAAVMYLVGTDGTVKVFGAAAFSGSYYLSFDGLSFDLS